MSDLFLKILNFSINASWLIVAVFILRKVLKKAPKWIFCVLWGLVAIRLICPVTLKSVLSLLPSSEVIPQNITISQQPVINTGIAVINNAVNPVISGTFAPEPVSSVNPLQVVAWLASIVWVAGMAAMAIYALISYIRLKRKVRISVPVDRDIITGGCETTDAVRNIRICDGIRTPFILGLFRPVIYVPSSVEGRARELVIAHEEAHLKRRDHWWKPLGFALLTVYWFNPLCWLAYILLCRDIESACDEKVIKEKDKDYIADYSQTLLDLSMPGKMVSACPLAFGETGVKGRVKGVLNYKKPAFWLILVALISCIAAGVCFLTDPVTSAEDEAAVPMDTMKVYYYSGNVVDEKGIIDFSITLNPDGTFTWYETPISSFIGMGNYVISDGILTLANDKEMTGNTDVNRFRIEGDKLYFIAEGSSNFPYVRLGDGAEFVYGTDPLADWWEQPVEEQQEDQQEDQLNLPLYQVDPLAETQEFKEYQNVPESVTGWLYEYEQNLDQQLEQMQGSPLNMICEDDTVLENGWTIDSVTIAPNYVIINCYYPEYSDPEENNGQACCMVTGVLLKDGTRIDCSSARYRWIFDRKNDQVIFEQAASLSDLLIETSTIDAVCIRIWDPEKQEFSEKEETIFLVFDELIDQYFRTGDTVVHDTDKLTVSIGGFYYFHSSHMYHLILRIIDHTDYGMTVSDCAVILNGVSIPDPNSYETAAGLDQPIGLWFTEEEVREAGIDAIESVGIHLAVDFKNEGHEHLDIEYTEDVSAPDSYIPKNADAKEEFLRWRLTTNLDDRWDDYHASMDKLMEEMSKKEVPASAVPGIYTDPELEERSGQIAAQYYSGIAAITSEEFISQMVQNRTPMQEDEMYLEYDSSMEFVDVTFSEGKEDPFASGLIYDFDARVIVNGYENIPDYPYKQDKDGYFHMTGQITVDNGLITKLYLAKP